MVFAPFFGNSRLAANCNRCLLGLRLRANLLMAPQHATDSGSQSNLNGSRTPAIVLHLGLRPELVMDPIMATTNQGAGRKVGKLRLSTK